MELLCNRGRVNVKMIVCLMLVTILFAGCKGADTVEEPVPEATVAGETGETGEAETAPDDAPKTAMDKARAAFHAGDMEGAMKAVEDGLADPAEAESQAMLFRALIDLHLMDDRVEDAQQKFLAMLEAEPDTAGMAFGMIGGHLRKQEDKGAFMAWAEKMKDADMPDSMRERVYSMYVDAHLVLEKFDAVPDLAATSIEDFGAPATTRLMGSAISRLVDNGSYDSVRSILSLLATAAPDDESVAGFLATTELSILAAQEKWDEMAALFSAKAGDMSDANLRSTLRTLSRKTEAADPAIIAGLCEYVIKDLDSKPQARSEAVSIWVKQAGKDNDKVVARLQQARTMGMPSADVQREISRVFYDAMGSASAESRITALSLVEWVLSEAVSDGTRDQFRALLMDGAVLNDDYKRALAVLESGFRADETEWHSMAVNKVKAHLALVEGRKQEAVDRFRKFMEHVATWTDATVDPSTGIKHTREMSLGFNAKRIAGILATMDDPAATAAAYAEAREYFAKALGEFKESDKEYTYIEQQVAELPAE